MMPAEDTPGSEGPPDFAYEKRSKAVEKAREEGGEWRINKKKIDGSQYFVIERKVDTRSMGGLDVEVWRDDNGA